MLGLEDGRFRVWCNIERSSVYNNGNGGKSSPGAPPDLTLNVVK